MTQFDNFTRRFEILFSELADSKNCNRLPSERTIQLERNAVNNAQYQQFELIEVNPVPISITNEELEDNICRALSLTCYRLEKETVIVKFKSRKQKRKILIDRKNFCNNFENLSQLTFAGKLFILESMFHENQYKNLFYMVFEQRYKC